MKIKINDKNTAIRFFYRRQGKVLKSKSTNFIINKNLYASFLFIFQMISDQFTKVTASDLRKTGANKQTRRDFVKMDEFCIKRNKNT